MFLPLLRTSTKEWRMNRKGVRISVLLYHTSLCLKCNLWKVFLSIFPWNTNVEFAKSSAGQRNARVQFSVQSFLNIDINHNIVFTFCSCLCFCLEVEEFLGVVLVHNAVCGAQLCRSWFLSWKWTTLGCLGSPVRSCTQQQSLNQCDYKCTEERSEKTKQSFASYTSEEHFEKPCGRCPVLKFVEIDFLHY